MFILEMFLPSSPGLGKRTPKTQVDTPKKSVVTLRTSTAKHEKEDDSHPVAARADKNQHIKSKDANFTGKEAEEIKALKKKCHDCENRILELKDGFHQKNLAIEAFIIVIKQHIKTVTTVNFRARNLCWDRGIPLVRYLWYTLT